MATIVRNCPHCHSQKNTFTLHATFKDPNPAKQHEYISFFTCGNCHEGYVIRSQSRDGQSPDNIKGNIEQSGKATILKEYPSPISTAVPEYLPDNIKSFFLQAADSLKSQYIDASAMMSRKVLEVAVKKLNPNGNGSLYKRIEQLEQIGLITQDLKDWAHAIRIDGNEVAHEETPATNELATELLSFVELFLMYTFTMPGMIESRRTSEE